jgi:hypothetical protein
MVVRHLFHSRDQGLTWEKLSIPQYFGNFYVAFSDTSNGLISDDFHKTARTTDGGKTWSVNYISVEDPAAIRLKIQKGTSNVWAQGDYGLQAVNYTLLYSSNFGSTWSRQTGNFPFYMMAGFSISGSVVWAGGCNYLIMRNTTPYVITSVSTPTNHPSVPASCELSQNYPNPFNPSTTIKYELPRAAQVKLIVYNTLGEIVTTLVNEQKPAGDYTVQFDGSGLASGVYFYRLQARQISGWQAGNFVQTKKFVLLR